MSEARYTSFSDINAAEEDFVEESGELIPSESNESFHYDPVKMTSPYHIGQGERALEKLKFVVEESGWKKALTVRSTTVYSKNGIDDDKVPVFMCEHTIDNFTPQSIFAVVGMRKLWDPWYEEGNLVENLDETTSLTYMVMQGVAGTRTRDLSLVEKIECTEDGTIYFATTSVETNKVPQVVDKIRASIHLNGWIIKPVSENPIRTKVTYVLQTKVNGWIPSVVAKKYLLKRPLVVHIIDQYLQKNGPPPVVFSASSASTRQSRSTSTSSNTTNINNPSRSSRNSTRSVEWADQQRIKSKRKKETWIKPSNETLNENKELSNDDTNSQVLMAHEGHFSSETQTSSMQKELQPTPDQFVQDQSPIQAQSTNPIQLTNSTQPTNPVQSTNSTQPTNPAQLTNPQPTNPVQPTIIVQPTNPVQPTIIVQPTDLVQPTNLIQPANIVQPTNLVQPTNNVQPTNPVQSTNPVQPINLVKTGMNLNIPLPPPSPLPTSQLPTSPLPIKHRFTDAVNKALAEFKDSAKTLEGWSFYSENKGVKIYTKDIVGRSTPMIRGDYTLSGGYTSDDLLTVIKNLDLRKLWDDRYEDGEFVEIYDSDNTLAKISMKGTFPISGRDFALCGTVEHDLETSKTFFVTTSVIDPAIPEAKKYVRGHINFTGWQINSKFDLNGNTKALDIIYIIDSDLKLEVVPQSILKSISTGTPLVIQKIDEMMRKIGFPPYIRNSPSLVISEKLEPKIFNYDLSLVIKNDFVKEIRFSKKMYPNGLNITITPKNAKVELLPNNSEIIRITFPSDGSTNEAQIKITKHKEGFKMTYNGNIIPSAQPVTPITQSVELPVEKEKKETERQYQNKRHSRKLSQSIIDPNATLVGDIADAMSSNNDNKDNEQDIRAPRKQKRLSFADAPSFINPETFFTKEEKRTSQLEVILANNENEELKKYEKYERYEKYEEHEVHEEHEEHKKHEEVMMSFIENPIKNNYFDVNKDIIIISDEVKLNSYLAGMMFLGMILSYYFGKLSCYLSL